VVIPVDDFRIDSPQDIDLNEYSTKNVLGYSDVELDAQLQSDMRTLNDLQGLMYGAAQHSLVIVLQGMDASGKDNTIKNVCTAFSPVGIHVWPFEKPNKRERHHDFLWRVHKVAPEDGMISVFNRSHYEDVLTVRVHSMVPQSVWADYYDEIINFEQTLINHNTIVVKFYLNISNEEQLNRLVARGEKVENAWKMNVQDWYERQFWDAYTEAYEVAIGTCSFLQAPWYIIPADDKKYKNCLIARALVETLSPYKSQWLQALEARQEAQYQEIEEFSNTGHYRIPLVTEPMAPSDAAR
jgi:PPK2 family polyphosphate:nucleotide phosphotransferase